MHFQVTGCKIGGCLKKSLDLCGTVAPVEKEIIRPKEHYEKESAEWSVGLGKKGCLG